MRVGSLFAGIGGFDLAARWVGWTTAWLIENNEYASAVLRKHWPTVPNHGDITLAQGSRLTPVDVLCGGFPCQDISFAGKGAGIQPGTRSGLWSHYARLIDELQPQWVVAENVAALRTRGLDRVLRDLDALGYAAEWHCIPASAVGAPHQRDRIWIIGYPHAVCERWNRGGYHWSGRPIPNHQEWLLASLLPYGQQSEFDVGSVGSLFSDRLRARLQRLARDVGARAERQDAAGSTPEARLLAGGYPEGWWDVEPDVGRVAHGIPHRVDRVIALGNAVVPQVPYELFATIQEMEKLCATR